MRGARTAKPPLAECGLQTGTFDLSAGQKKSRIDMAKEFRLPVLIDAFKKALPEDGTILIDEYARGYDELCSFFDILGSMFGFITSDIREKIDILRHHRSGNSGAKYETVQSMMEYEIENDLTAAKTKPLSGSRTLLRLHRALAFVMLFLENLSKSSDQDSSANIASDAYNNTLAEFHPWTVRKLANLAMYTLPNVGDMVVKAGGKTDHKEARDLLKEGAGVMKPLYDKTEALYTEKDLHGLP